MTYSEALSWAAYRKRHGGFNLALRVEWATAMLASVVNRSLGGKSVLADFLPVRNAPPPQSDGDLRSVFNLLKGGGRG